MQDHEKMAREVEARPGHVERMLAEREQLHARLVALRAFIRTAQFGELCEDERLDMLEQRAGMQHYSYALDRRLKRAGGLAETTDDSPLETLRSQTLGEYRVGMTFNPSGSGDVYRIKTLAAALIDAIAAISAPRDTPVSETRAGEIGRCKALAVTATEDAAMWAVKAATKPERE